MVDLRQSEAYARWMETMGWKSERIFNSQFSIFTYFYIRKVPLVGSVMKVLRPVEPIPYKEIEEIARKHRALFVKIEPGETPETQKILKVLKEHGYNPERWALLATKTLRVDLRDAEDKIFSRFKKDCRYEIKMAQGRGLTTRHDDFDSFYEMVKRANKIKRLWTLPKEQFQNLILCFSKDVFCICIDESIHRYKGIAGCLVLVADNTAYYFLAGSLPEGKEVHAPYLAVWEAMKEAKRRGCTTWDFEGLQDERIPSTKSWAGFSHFKRSFGGTEVIFPGTFTKYRNPIMKLLSPFA